MVEKTKSEKSTILKWLNIPEKGTSENSQHAYISIAKRKLPARSVKAFMRISKLPKSQISKIIHISERTLERNSPDKKLSITASEKLLELSKLFFKGYEIFEDEEKFRNWLQEESIALGRQKPIDLLQTSIGIELVSDELIRIEHGVFS